jgi:Transposase DDE domain
MIAHPALAIVSSGFSREDLFLVVYCVVDDWMHARFGASSAPRFRRGPRSDEFSDAEVLTVVLVGELCHCHRERSWLRQVRASYSELFPALPEDSRFARRAERVRFLLGALRDSILRWADADLEPLRIMDSFPLSLCACYRIHHSNFPVEGSAFGRCASKRAFFFGLRPQVLITFSGFVVDIALAGGNCPDSKALALYLDECQQGGRDLRGQTWLLDKGYRNKQLVRQAREQLGLTLMPREQEARGDEPTPWQLQLDAFRRGVEGVIAILTDCFGIEHILATKAMGIFRRVQAKATAFTLARYLNRVLDLPALNIARYAV